MALVRGATSNMVEGFELGEELWEDESDQTKAGAKKLKEGERLDERKYGSMHGGKKKSTADPFSNNAGACRAHLCA